MPVTGSKWARSFASVAVAGSTTGLAGPVFAVWVSRRSLRCVTVATRCPLWSSGTARAAPLRLWPSRSSKHQRRCRLLLHKCIVPCKVVTTTLFSFEDVEGAKLFVRILARSGEDFALLRDYDDVWVINPDTRTEDHVETIAAECGGSVLIVV